jgi:hypothetical protein
MRPHDSGIDHGIFVIGIFGKYLRLLAEVRQQATGNRQQWEELEFFGIKLI